MNILVIQLSSNGILINFIYVLSFKNYILKTFFTLQCTYAVTNYVLCTFDIVGFFYLNTLYIEHTSLYSSAKYEPAFIRNFLKNSEATLKLMSHILKTKPTREILFIQFCHFVLGDVAFFQMFVFISGKYHPWIKCFIYNCHIG